MTTQAFFAMECQKFPVMTYYGVDEKQKPSRNAKWNTICPVRLKSVQNSIIWAHINVASNECALFDISSKRARYRTSKCDCLKAPSLHYTMSGTLITVFQENLVLQL